MRIMIQIDADVTTVPLAEFARVSCSLTICRDTHRWPPLVTLNGFLACGYDDVDGGRVMRWSAFAIDAMEYEALRAAVDPAGTVDALGTDPGDWRSWFSAAVTG